MSEQFECFEIETCVTHFESLQINFSQEFANFFELKQSRRSNEIAQIAQNIKQAELWELPFFFKRWYFTHSYSK